jgi:hypothetical protein
VFYCKPISLLSVSEAQIIDKARIVGVSLGASHAERMESAKLIKHNELHRTLTILKNNDNRTDLVADVSQCLVVTRASNLCEDLEDEESLLDEDVIEEPLNKCKTKPGRKKKSYDKANVRRSKRIRIKKSRL